jgi:hypothetical protein
MNFKQGDVVYATDRNTVGEIVEINGDQAIIKSPDAPSGEMTVNLRKCTQATELQIQSVMHRRGAADSDVGQRNMREGDSNTPQRRTEDTSGQNRQEGGQPSNP